MKKSTTPRFGVILAIVLVVIGLAACGGGGGGGGSDANTTTRAPEASWTNAVIPTAQGNEAAMKFAASAMSAALRASIGPYNGVSPVDAAEQGLNWAEQTFPQYFPGHKTTQSFECYRYRFYPEAATYVGIAINVAGKCGEVKEGGAYVMGGVFGNFPVYQGQLTDYTTPSTLDFQGQFSFVAGDVRVYTATPVGGAAYMSTVTILAMQGNKAERVQTVFSDGSPAIVRLYDSQGRDVSSTTGDGMACTFSPPRDNFYSTRGTALKVGESFTQDYGYTCTRPGSSIPGTRGTTALTGIETVTTPAGTFPNARVFTVTSVSDFSPGAPTLRSTYWVDPVMNREVRSRTVQIQNGVETLRSTTELTSFTIRNYPLETSQTP
jgi:hypothetical protein